MSAGWKPEGYSSVSVYIVTEGAERVNRKRAIDANEILANEVEHSSAESSPVSSQLKLVAVNYSDLSRRMNSAAACGRRAPRREMM